MPALCGNTHHNICHFTCNFRKSVMKFQVINFIRVAVMLSGLMRLTKGYVRPAPKVDLQAPIDLPALLQERIDLPALLDPYTRNWVDTGGLSCKQPYVTASELKIISYNVLGMRMTRLDCVTSIGSWKMMRVRAFVENGCLCIFIRRILFCWKHF